VAAIRLFTQADLPALLHLSRSASWNQTSDDWARLLTFEPLGCFGIEIDGVLAASTVVITYAQDLAWIGMVLTLPEFRGRGLGRRLMEHAIEYSGSRIIRLDASDMGKALYESLGFQEECIVERWLRDPSPSPAIEAETFKYPQTLDTEAFQADRSALIRSLAGHEAASLTDQAFALGRPGSNTAYFGPCVSATPADARHLLQWFLARHPAEPVFWDLFPQHLHAPQIAAEFGFRPVRRLTRMSLHAPAIALPDPRIYAIAGFEYG